MARGDQQRVCFVIAPIGEEGSETRTRSDQVLNHVIAPAAKECGYAALRADNISEPGIITSQVIQHLVEDPLVIADLTGHNPNVFYELAVRHAVRKAIVQIIHAGESIPFDVGGTRTIPLDHRDLDSVARCREELVRQIRAVERDVSQVDNPISVSVDLQSLRGSDKPLEKSTAQILSMLQDLQAAVGDLAKGPLPARRPDPRMIQELEWVLGRVDASLASDTAEGSTSVWVEEARHHLRHAMRVLDMLAEKSDMPRPLAERAYALWARRQAEPEPGK